MKAQSAKGSTGKRAAARKATPSGRNGGAGINRQGSSSASGYYHDRSWPSQKSTSKSKKK